MLELGIDRAFTVIGDDEEQTPGDLTGADPGTVAVINQRLYLDDGYFDRGEEVGWAHGTAIVDHHGRAVCHFTFVLVGQVQEQPQGEGSQDEEQPPVLLTAHGVVPIEDSTLGAGRLVVTGGSGTLKGARGTIAIEVRNPKRWSFLP
jgi:hypothetical protein